MLLLEGCEIGASSWFYYKQICYDARSRERKKINECWNIYDVELDGEL
jgi:hypothetical protein